MTGEDRAYRKGRSKRAKLAELLVVLPDAEAWAALRGAFDARARIEPPSRRVQRPRVELALEDDADRAAVQAFTKIHARPSVRGLVWEQHNALDLLAKLYEGARVANAKKRAAYRAWAAHVPQGPPTFRWRRLDPEAVPPFKERASDSGYDLTLIRRAKVFGTVTLYGTGIAVEPDYGWYFDVVPRSSIIKTGHLLANSVGVIDRTYRGELLVPLTKVDAEAPDLALPCRLVQMIPRPIVHAELREADALEDTARAGGGFGSTGEKAPANGVRLH